MLEVPYMTDSLPKTVYQKPKLTRLTRLQAQQRLERIAVLELARKLYQCHAQVWPSLSLNEDSSTPSGERRSTRGGGFFLRASLFGREISTLVTELAYRQAMQRLSALHLSEIGQYYLRRPAKGDTCPALERSEYAEEYRAFRALLHELLPSLHGKTV